MSVDLWLGAFLLAAGLLGLYSGALKQLSQWAGLAAAYLAARPLAAALTPSLTPFIGLTPAALKVAISVVLFYALFALTALAAHRALKKLAGDREKGRADRAAGFFLGAGKGAVIAFVLISLLLYFEKPLIGSLGPPSRSLQTSVAVAVVREHNLFDVVPVPALAQAQKLLEAARDPKAALALASDPKIKELLADPKLKDLMQDEAVAQALKTGDWAALMKDPRLAALLSDPKLAEAMAKVQPAAAPTAEPNP